MTLLLIQAYLFDLLLHIKSPYPFFYGILFDSPSLESEKGRYER